MRIVHVVESFAGGIFDFLVDLTNELSDCEHVIIHGRRENTPQNFQYLFPLSTMFYYWKNADREINCIKDIRALFELLYIFSQIQDYDIIHLHSSKGGFLGRIVLKLIGMDNKIVYTSHGVSFLRKDVSKFKKKIYILLEKIGNQLGGINVACSKTEAEIFLENGIPAIYIYNGINYTKSKINLSKDKILTDNLTICTIGRITNQKNPVLFNNIAKKFLSNPSIRFLWIGDGELKHILTSANIEITGWLTKDDVEMKLKESDIYISTASWEGLSLSVLQAMKLEKPIVLSKCIGNIDLVCDNKNGFIYDNLDEAVTRIKQLIESKDLRKTLGRESANLVKTKFALEKTMNDYRTLYIALKGM